MRTISILLLIYLSNAGSVVAQEKLQSHTYADGSLQALAISADGRRYAVAVSPYESILVYDRPAGQVLAKYPRELGHNRALAFSPDGKKLAFSLFGEDANKIGYLAVRIVPADKAGPGVDLKGPDADVGHLMFGPTGKYLAASQDGGKLFLWDVGEKSLILQSGEQVCPSSLVFSPDGQELAAASEDRSLVRWDIREVKGLKKPKPVQTSSTRYPTLACSYAPDGKDLIIGTKAGEIEKWRAGGAKPAWRMALDEVPESVDFLALSPNAAVAASARGRTITVSSTTSGKCLYTLSHSKGHEIGALAFSADGAFLLSGATADLPKRQSEVILWKLELEPKK